MGSKRIVLFLDGTWNSPNDETRVFAAYKLAQNSETQKVKYFKGLGTQNFETFRGGVFGKGLGRNVKEAYSWLSNEYEKGDELFIFGFSRGAFTATSIAGMIMRWGLLRANAELTTDQIFKLYENWDQLRPIYELYGKDEENLSELEKRILIDSRRVNINFLGLWDSVASVGVPIGNFSRFSKNSLKFHNPRCGSLHRKVCHALAIDENRKPFRPVILHDFIPGDESDDETTSKRIETSSRIEQRWFCGSHGDVGGGDNLKVSNAPYAWIINEAVSAGLEVNGDLPIAGNEFKFETNDSFSKFLFGFYKSFRFGVRFRRAIGGRGVKKKHGLIEPINEVIDSSVFERWQSDSKYRPKHLKQILSKKDCDPDNHVGDFHFWQNGRPI